MNWDVAKRITQSTIRASRSATEDDRERAHRAERELRDDRNHPDRCFVFNGYLNLVGRGVATTEKNILEESRKIAKANEVHLEAQAKRRDERRAVAA